MDRDLQQRLDGALRAMATRLGDEHALAAELQRARRTFFGDGVRVAGRGIAETREQRFLEWFLLERESEVLGAVPVTVSRFCVDDVVLGSCVGVYAIVAASDGGATARDLQDDSVLDLAAPGAALAMGDLVIGRLFPAGVGSWLPSRAATVFRPGGPLGEAFCRDLLRLDLDRRLTQVELEHLLLRRPGGATGCALGDRAPPLEHLEADLERLLGPTHPATAVSAALAATDRPGQVMGPLLDELAFDTGIDLEATRRTLLEIWNAHHPTAATGAAAAAATAEQFDAAPERGDHPLGERMVQALDEGLRQHRDVNALFADLEAMAGLEPGAADDDENPFDRGDDAATTAGNLEALVQEYLWETGGGDDHGALRTWVRLQAEAAVPRHDLEDMTAADLERLLVHVYLAAAPAARAAAVTAASAALRDFLGWAERTQEVAGTARLIDGGRGLLAQLPRLCAAGRLLSGAGPPGPRPALREVAALGTDGLLLVGDDGADVRLSVPAAAAAELRVGDLVLGALAADAGAFVGPVVVLPAAARKLFE
jgi:hypothetical protein